MSANRHPNWLKEARRAEGGGVDDDDKMRSQHLNEMQNEASQQNQQGIGSQAMNQALSGLNTPFPQGGEKKGD